MNIAELRQLAEQASPGPWTPWYQSPNGVAGSNARSLGREPNLDWGLFRQSPTCREMDEFTDEIGRPTPFSVADAALISAARNVLPALLDVVEAALRWKETAENVSATGIYDQDAFDDAARDLASAVSCLEEGR